MPAIPFDELPYDQQHFLDLLDRAMGDYLLPWKLNANSGYEIIKAFAEIGERLSLAVNRFEQGGLAIFAEGGLFSQVEVEFSRPTAAAGAFTLKAGTVVTTSTGDRRFYLLTDVVFGGAAVGPIAADVAALGVGFEWNVPGEINTAGGETLEGEIDTIFTLITDPAFADTTLTVSQVATASGGRSAQLDVVGYERGVERALAEPDDPYRLRIRTIPDTISPDAVKRFVHGVLDPWGLPFAFIEVFQSTYVTCWDAPSPNAGTPSYDGGVAPTSTQYDHTTFVFDDPRNPEPFRNRWLDGVEWRGAFIIVVRRDLTLHELGMVHDDPGTLTTDFHPVGGPTVGYPWRGTPAHDSPGGIAANPNVYIAAHDGADVLRGSIYAGLYLQLQTIRAAGVAAIVEYVRT